MKKENAVTRILSLLLCTVLLLGCLPMPASAEEANQWSAPEDSLLNYIQDPQGTTPYPETAMFSQTRASDQATSTANYQAFLRAAPSQYLLSRNQIKRLCPWKSVSDSDLNYVEQKAKEITQDCTTDYEKIYAVSKYLSQNVCYDFDYYTHDAYPYTQLNLNPRDVLVNESTVCSGYAVTAASMLQLLGIPCVYVDSPNHAWNIAHDGTRWVMFDATWISASRMEYGIKEKNPNLRMDWFDFSLTQANNNTYHLINGLPTPSGSLPQPQILAQPLDHDILPTDPLTLSALVIDDVSCQWYVHTECSTDGGTPIPGATEISYTPGNLEPGTYYYYAIMTNSSGQSNATYPSRVRVFEELPEREGLLSTNLRYQYFPNSHTLRLTGSGTVDEDTLYHAHLYCTNLEVGSDVTVIPSAITEKFDSWTTVQVDEGNPIFSTDESGAFLNHRDGILLLLPNSGITSYAIAEGIVRVEKNAFQTYDLTSLSIPASLRELPDGLGRSRMESITVHPDNPVFYVDEHGALINETTKTLVRAPISPAEQTYVVDEAITQLETLSFYGCQASEIKLHDRITAIGDSAFEDSWYKPAVFPSALTEIGNEVYSDAYHLRGKVILPDGIFRMGQHALSSCYNMTELVLPEMLQELGLWTFANNSALTSVTIPEGITEIPQGCFSGCSSLTELVLPKGVETIARDALFDMTALTSLTIPSSVTTIHSSSFANPSAVTVYGCIGTAAETFAKEQGMQFVDITNHAEAISPIKENLYLPAGQVIKPKLQVAPADTTDAVKLSVSDEAVVRVINGMFLEGLRPGTVTVTATTANGLSCSFQATVAELSAVKIQSLPKRLTFAAKEPLDTTGLEAVWCFADGAETPADRFLVLGYDPDTSGEQTIHVGLGDVWTTFTVQVAEPLSGEIQEDLQWSMTYGNVLTLQGTLSYYDRIYAASYDAIGKMISIGMFSRITDVVYAHPDASQIKMFLIKRYYSSSFTPYLEHPIIIPLGKTE